ncbi:heparinase II/III family protein [Roseisalinus antarcticus]|uniref:Heparinase II/III-like protein n=1 Tax=Roseisalinus antarcticus TaxID=254357 RepID=A0A1Y5SM90_9RHOB|nr:heparinase II/III family protein [Roseisalinus antarcticus]SLN43428.1 Heparinase II/III-like protein [Roseisalinus antarcticus]
MVNVRIRSARTTRLLNRLQARVQARRGRATGFVSSPEPRSIGHFAKGRQLCAGNILFAGHLVETEGKSLWSIAPPGSAFAEAMHGFTWLDDLAAVGDAKARATARTWVWEWIASYGAGQGPGWAADVAGRRVIRWITHAQFLLRGQDKPASDAFFRSLSGQTRFLARRWRAARPGLPRFEALTGLIYAGLSIEGHDDVADPAVQALARHCDEQIDADGGLATRSPEHLMEVLTLLNWCVEALTASDRPVPAEFGTAIARIAPTLRALRHADGGLARFHGGGRGLDGRLDQALAASGTRTRPDLGALHMGFARLAAGRTTVIADAAAPPAGPSSADGHASTLAFEVTSGRRPIVVNCGSGAIFGDAWRRAGRATPSHSTLGLDGYSSARLGAPARHDGMLEEWLEEVPADVIAETSRLSDGMRVELAHDGYRMSHGLTHARTLELTIDGRGLVGEDVLATLSDGDESRFDRQLHGGTPGGVPFSVRFHLHPDVDAALDLSGAAVSLALKSGEIWILRHDGSAEMTLEPSVYLEKGRLRPRAAKQVVLSGRAMAYATRVRWSLAKARETPNVMRDLAETDPFADLEAEESP